MWRQANSPFQVALRTARDRLLQVHPNKSEQTVPFRHLAHTPDLRAQARFTALVEKAASDQAVELLPPSDVRGRARLLSASSPGAAAWLQALPLYAALTCPTRSTGRRCIGSWGSSLPALQVSHSAKAAPGTPTLRSWPRTCSVAPTEASGPLPMIFCAMGVFIEAGFKVAVECSSVMPILRGEDGRSHTRRADLVAIPPGGGPRIITDVVTTDSYERLRQPHQVGVVCRACGRPGSPGKRKNMPITRSVMSSRPWR
eukprot:SM005544S18173  [mRNA]  locus=s5544:26:804:+ [translate_table: standard]